MRIAETIPQRRDNPLRYENLTDVEVREIQAATLQALPDVIVNIGSVVTGCGCEDGSDCSDQVWILANRGARTTGLQLSKIRGHWKIGPVQAWWLEYEALKRKRDTIKDYLTYREMEYDHKERFPQCSRIG